MPSTLLSRVGVLLACLILLAGCAARVGPQTAGGTYLTLNGEAVNAYADALDETVEAGLQVLASLGTPIRFKQSGGPRTVVFATAPDGSPLRLQFEEEGRRLTTVRIRTGTVGFWRRELSFYLHVLIDARLKQSDLAAKDADPDDQAFFARVAAASKASDTVRPRTQASSQTTALVKDKDDTVGPDAPSSASAGGPLTGSALLPAPKKNGSSLSEKPEAQVYFETDSNFPKTGELAKLDRIASLLIANPSWRLSMEGFAEAYENGGHPRIVAESRTLAVRFYLVGKGVEDDRLSMGETDSKRGEMDPGVQNHRRVDIWLRRLP